MRMPLSYDALAPTAKMTLWIMTVNRDLGRTRMTKLQVMGGTGSSKRTVCKVMGDFVSAGWIVAHDSCDPMNGGRRPTLYQLTDAAPDIPELAAYRRSTASLFDGSMPILRLPVYARA